MCLLSIIIPVYNAAPFLDECLDSIINTTGNNNKCVELLLVNDGSTDSSAEICDLYSEKYFNVRSFHKENSGVASARNLGLKNAKGRYIAWVDSDDYVDLHWFSNIEEAIRHGEPDVIIMDTIRFGPDGKIIEAYGREKGFVPRDLFVEDVIRDIRMLSGLPNKVMKADLFRDVHFDESLSILEDFAAMPDILRNATSVYHLCEPLYYYRQHRTSLLHHGTAERAFMSVKIALEREACTEKQFRNAAVTATAQQMFLFYRNSCMYPEFRAEKSQKLFCQNYIRKHVRTICKDVELSKLQRLKIVLVSIGVYDLIARIKNKVIRYRR